MSKVGDYFFEFPASRGMQGSTATYMITAPARALTRILASDNHGSPLGAHSEKPWEVRHRLELLYGDVPRIELFSRSAAPGWDAWGNEVDGDVKLVPGRYENAE